MGAFIRSFLASFLALVVLIAALLGWVAAKTSAQAKIEDHSYLVIDLYGQIPEYPVMGGLLEEIVGGEGETLHRILTNLAKAQVDDRIAGVIMKFSSHNDLGFAAMQEIRSAVHALRAAGKPVFGFCDSMDQRTYFLAAACDSLYAAPTAYVTYHGFAAVSTHVRGTLEKLGVEPEVHQLREYKAAAEVITRDNLSAHARENRQWILAELWDVYTAALQADRGLTTAEVEQLMAKAVLTADDAVVGGLFDRLAYWDQLADQLKAQGNERLRTVGQERYAHEDPEDLGLKGKHKVAVVHANGMIGGRRSRIDPLLGVMMGHETVTADLQRAREDEDVVAIVLRVDSQGGESLTSDLIGRAVALTAQSKPVVVSMVNVAASGGYMVAYRANRLIANPLTITGSIGSISARFNLEGLYTKLGVTHDAVTAGPMALFDVSYRNLTDQEWERFTENHWDEYNAWLRDIARWRRLELAELEGLVHGRVWSGRQAVANGLVDELGGLERAIAVAKELAEIPPEKTVTLVHYPQQKDLFELLFGGEEDPVSIARWVFLRSLNSDWAETRHFLTGARLAWWPGFALR